MRVVVSGQSGIILVHFMLEKLEGKFNNGQSIGNIGFKTQRKQTKQKKV